MQIERGDFEQTRSHWWWRPGWGPETRYLTFHLTFGSEPALAEASRACAGVLASLDTMAPVPVDGLHLTMTGVGFAADISAETLAALSVRVLDDAAARADGGPPLVLDTLFLGMEAIMLTGPCPDWLAMLKREQERAVEDLVGAPGEWSGFWPHTSLAYFSGVVDEDTLVSGLGGVGLDDVVVTRPTLSLLELRREDHLYTWRSLGERVLELDSGRE
ncbi:hypothetical protein [Salana multivorans]